MDNIPLFLPRICLLGNKLLASSSYHKCSRNDTLLNSTYGDDETFWKNNPLSYVVGVPGITSGVYVGKISRQSKLRLISVSDCIFTKKNVSD